jgi:hypothetical protein
MAGLPVSLVALTGIQTVALTAVAGDQPPAGAIAERARQRIQQSAFGAPVSLRLTRR